MGDEMEKRTSGFKKGKRRRSTHTVDWKSSIESHNAIARKANAETKHLHNSAALYRKPRNPTPTGPVASKPGDPFTK
jgi:hypothetical protein